MHKDDIELLLEILKLVAILGAGVGVIITILKTAGGVVVTVTKAVTRFEFVGEQQASEIKELKVAISKQNDILMQMAVEKIRLDNQGARLTRMEQLLDDLRRGEGYILPLRSVSEFGSGGKGPG